ncbi:MAG TPA: FAD-dependent oxidoreductase [Gammaproteobacteria bacterium]|nr:FAD-dependent oxidoreductase [Gammaproteobacteria bacterium]HQZ87961.1 FAD-dependent oxidoreductase [Gammaproteobacteria bacterium]HRA42457.1 FAD-dependent oxidoreductase [Gammaproteobacteria bacterium]
MNTKDISLDIVIFGGGIAGLWTLNQLRRLGYQAILLETHTLGGGQTIKSQGIIHGGMKYALSGFLSGSANTIETMPQRWKDALAGAGELDLSTVNVLSEDQLLWSTGSLGSEVASFFASKALNSRIQKLPKTAYPSILKNSLFKGHAYRLEEVVLDMPSLIETLTKPHSDYIFKINPNAGYAFTADPNNPQNVVSLKIFSDLQQTVNIKAKRYLFTAGEGNRTLGLGLPNAPQMQVRPLQMVMVKLALPFPFFAHCIDNGTNPRITITTHPTQDGKSVWYLGGQLAEDGAKRTTAEQIAYAKKEVSTLFPWLDLSGATWASFFINRAEPKQPDGKRPENPFIKTLGNIMTAWPTKLALAPMLSDLILTQLKQQNILPSQTTDETKFLLARLEKPAIALPPWEQYFS